MTAGQGWPSIGFTDEVPLHQSTGPSSAIHPSPMCALCTRFQRTRSAPLSRVMNELKPCVISCASCSASASLPGAFWAKRARALRRYAICSALSVTPLAMP